MFDIKIKNSNRYSQILHPRDTCSVGVLYFKNNVQTIKWIGFESR